MKKNKTPLTSAQLDKRRKQMEGVATFGLLLIAVAMLGPFMNFGTSSDFWMAAYKWIYAAGALIYTFARVVSVSDPRDSLRLRRLRRLEFWAGMAFCIGAFFWFYNAKKYEEFPFVGILAIVKDTVVFSLAGALIQVIASWLISFREQKERKERENGKNVGGKEGKKARGEGKKKNKE